MIDSTIETKKHISTVRDLIYIVVKELNSRTIKHDQSKLESLEKEIFDEYTPKLKNTTYGSEEYKQFLKEMKPALDNHYKKNRHHPEHYENGIQDMTIVDIVEMIADWAAATKRHADGCIGTSIVKNAERFGFGEDLVKIFLNTAREYKIGAQCEKIEG